MRDVPHGATSVIQRVKLRDLGSSSDGGKTGLTKNSAGLQITSMTDNEKTRTVYTAAASTIEAIASIGVYTAPSSTTFCRFQEVDASALPGHYEIHLADSRYAVVGAKVLYTTIFGTASAAQTDLETRLHTPGEQDTLNSGLFAVVSAVQVKASAIKSDTSALVTTQAPIGANASAAVANTVTLITQVSAVLTDTGTTLPAQVSTVKVDASSANTQASEANAALPAIGVAASAAVVNTNTILSKVSAVKVDTGTTLPATASANQVLASARGTMQTSIFALASTTKITASTTKTNVSSIDGRIPAALASGFMKSDVQRINSNANAAARMALSAAQIIPFTVDETLASATVANFHSDATLPVTTNNFWNDTLVIWTTGNLAGQRTEITASASATGGRVLFTMASTTSEPTTGDTGILL